MINDPLLPSRTPQRQENMTSPTPQKKSKTSRRSPARSAKILTLGLSTTAMLGMSSGYAFADMAHKDDNTTPTPTQIAPVAAPAATQQSQTTVAPVAASSPAASPAVVAPQQSAVIEVAVPSGGATPGSGNTAWKKQKSSGSK
ncbi:MAG: hypothetical protein F2545_07565 [Actinobacteria bacterium]|uniref:Unannotated protein n=1 Tax=freshwater metagenome TaxID=449393 RepID=A0A6J6E4X1_9ZZZZ|nr:hypothetical protein [Actinomycetota bacterium]